MRGDCVLFCALPFSHKGISLYMGMGSYSQTMRNIVLPNEKGVTKMAASIAEKKDMLKQFDAVKQLFDYKFVEEESLSKLVNQLAENMYEHVSVEENQDYLNYKLLKQLKKERDQARGLVVLHRGSFL